MANRLLFEEDLPELNQDERHEPNVNTSVKQGNLPNEENSDVENWNKNQELEESNSHQDKESNSNKNTQHENSVNEQDDNMDTNSAKDTTYQNNVTNIEKCFEVPIENVNQGNTDQDADNIGKINQNEQNKGNNAKGKKKKPSELELLGVNIKDEDLTDTYDVFGDENQIFRKYKLRKSEQIISYKEPKDLKPELLEFDVGTSYKPKLNELFCTLCNIGFNTVKGFQMHKRNAPCQDKVLEYTCSLCSQKFDDNADLIAHKTIHTESFLCEQCKLAFSDHCDFLIHNLKHANQSTFDCPECGLKYFRNSYKIHIVTHFDKKVSCPICPFSTNGEFNLQRHINEHKYEKTCVECGKKLKSKKMYEYHMSSHTGVKRYQCLYCGRCFGNQSQKEVHTRLHTGEKRYTCDICGLKATQSSTLKQHKITHEAEKKHSCPICHKKFFHKLWVKTHMRSHTKKCLYECPECGKKIISMSGLKGHIMFKHTMERPVECKPCNKKFIDNAQYGKHKKSKYHLRNVYASVINEK